MPAFHPNMPIKSDPLEFPAAVIVLASITLVVMAPREQETVDPVGGETLEESARLQVFPDTADFPLRRILKKGFL